MNLLAIVIFVFAFSSAYAATIVCNSQNEYGEVRGLIEIDLETYEVFVEAYGGPIVLWHYIVGELPRTLMHSLVF